MMFFVLNWTKISATLPLLQTQVVEGRVVEITTLLKGLGVMLIPSMSVLLNGSN